MPLNELPTLAKLLEKAEEKFFDMYGEVPTARVVAPGRVNLIGEHTDYNNGFVLPVALPMLTVMVSRKAESNRCCIHTLCEEVDENNTVIFSILGNSDIPVRAVEQWPNYIKGVISNFHLFGGPKPPAFDAVIVSSVPVGSGLSSSAALEVATLLTCEALTSFHSLSIRERVLLCQQAEHVWADSPCGIMDQMVCLQGRSGHAVLIDCESMESSIIETKFLNGESAAAQLVIIDSGVKHKIASSKYVERRKQCDEIAETLEVSKLRELQIKYSQMQQLIQRTQTTLSEVHARRLRHVLTENQRVLDSVKAVCNSNCVDFGKLMVESHNSLRDDYEVTCAEIDKIFDILMSIEGVYGARMTGGGFGGCLVALIDPKCLDLLVGSIQERYSPSARIFVVKTAAGAHILPMEKDRTISDTTE